MGLQNQLTDVSSDSIPIFVLAIVANAVCYLRSLLFTTLRSLGLSRHRSDQVDDHLLLDAVGSGLAGLIVLAEQLNLNRAFSNRYTDAAGPDCVVCLNGLNEGEQVCKLACHHVFHKECFEGWLDQLNFSCPLCRSPLVSDERLTITRRRVAGDLLAWFPLR